MSVTAQPPAEIKFSCPGCGQHIRADLGYAGKQIACPACNAGMTVPGAPSDARAAAPILPPLPGTETATCPSCSSPLASGATLCVNCGYSVAIGKKVAAGRPTPVTPSVARRVVSGNRETPWYKTLYAYVGAFLVVLSVLFVVGRTYPVAMFVSMALAFLYMLVVGIAVLVTAFKESVGTGFMTLCIPFYALYFVFVKSESDTLKFTYGLSLILGIAFQIALKSIQSQVVGR